MDPVTSDIPAMSEWLAPTLGRPMLRCTRAVFQLARRTSPCGLARRPSKVLESLDSEGRDTTMDVEAVEGEAAKRD